MEYGILLHSAVVAEELAIGTLGLDVAALIQVALQHPLRVRGHAYVATDAPHHRERRIAQARDEAQLVYRQAHDRGDVVGGVRANDESDRQPPSLLHRRLVERAQVGRRIEIDAGLAPAAQHQAAHADVGPAVRGIDDEIDRGGNVGATVHAVLQVDRQRRQVRLVACQHDFLGRCRLPRHLDHLRRCVQAAKHFGEQLVGRRAEGARQAGAAAHDVADELRAFPAHALEEHRLRIALERRGDLRQVRRSRPHFELARLSQFLYKAAQPEPLEIDPGFAGARLHRSNPPRQINGVSYHRGLARPSRCAGIAPGLH